MGRLIRRNRADEAIREDVLRTKRRADERGGVVRDLAEERLGTHLPLLEEAEADVAAAVAEEDRARARVESVFDAAMREVAAVGDELYNGLGRPRRSSVLAAFFPQGLATYASATPPAAVELLGILARKLDKAVYPSLTAERRVDWAARIRTVQAPLAEAVAAHARTVAQRTLEKKVKNAVVDAAWEDLGRLKRDYKNAGMTEAQVHQIIPNEPLPSERPVVAGAGGDAADGNGAGAPVSAPAAGSNGNGGAAAGSAADPPSST